MTERRARWLLGVAAFLALLAVGPAIPANATTSDTTPPEPFDILANVGAYQTGYSVASPYSNIYVTWEPATDDQSAVTYEVAADGQVVRLVTDAYGSETITKRIEVPDGTHVVTVTAIDASGNRRDSTHSLDVVVDKVSPWFTSLPTLVLRPGPVTSEGYPMRYTWSGEDEGTGLVAARIGPNEDCCYTVDPTLTHFDFTIPPRSEAVWRMWLVDGVGRMVKVPRSGYVAPAAWSDTTRSNGWRNTKDGAALDGSEWQSHEAGARMSITTSGKSIGWVTSTGPQRGRADVMMHGRVVDTINLYSANRHPARVVWTASLPRHDKAVKVTIVNRSPKQRPLVGVDAILIHD